MQWRQTTGECHCAEMHCTLQGAPGLLDSVECGSPQVLSLWSMASVGKHGTGLAEREMRTCSTNEEPDVEVDPRRVALVPVSSVGQHESQAGDGDGCIGEDGVGQEEGRRAVLWARATRRLACCRARLVACSTCNPAGCTSHPHQSGWQWCFKCVTYKCFCCCHVSLHARFCARY